MHVYYVYYVFNIHAIPTNHYMDLLPSQARGCVGSEKLLATNHEKVFHNYQLSIVRITIA